MCSATGTVTGSCVTGTDAQSILVEGTATQAKSKRLTQTTVMTRNDFTLEQSGVAGSVMKQNSFTHMSLKTTFISEEIKHYK